jgi:signal transduction histidine kinase
MIKILVIEDADQLRKDIVEMLLYEGFDIQDTDNGAAGVEIARNYNPDIIICDIMMPGMDGYDVLNALNGDGEMNIIPFIFLTAKTDRADIRYGMGLGADDYLTKPFVASELLSAIKARLAKRETFNEIAEQKLKELRESIITALPHELRTPLNTIIGFSDMLISKADSISPAQITDWAQHINCAAQRLYRLSENYLIYVRAEIASRNQEETEILKDKRLGHPGAIVEFQATHKAQQADRKDDLVLNLARDANIRCSDYDLSKVLEEIIDNALKFSEPGTPVTVETSEDDGYYVIKVTDQGRGMVPKQVESIGVYMQFDRWLHEQQGSGLGLAIASRLIELYGGEINVDSTVDVGTVVTMKLLLE